ncbi:carboxymuconolactone decarboxylase family protein [Nocardioides sp.]|uniref:carboxymuconolactone decarboxylase family protein n=1 Tax=Nocardioides sp. TaxID=35761 RepID=UPI001A1C3009|nr:carboxymuconolactone decarboxylase family protein [Nocardioides sp.]MBJ7357392.1 carboxymuconolactone decarboxylase family protein [Nocardioides sp.]
MARMTPIPPEDCTDPALAEALAHFTRTLGFVPNSLLTMQRVPAIAMAVIQLNRAVFAADGQVDLGLKRLVAHVASTASGCQYCKAHTTVSATRHGVSDEKMAAIYEYSTSPLFSPAERVALDFAMEAASVPNGVTDESYRALAEHWTETQIVELLGVVCMFGVFNRWNDSMATPLEEVPLARADELLGDRGWEPGKHVPGA